MGLLSAIAAPVLGSIAGGLLNKSEGGSSGDSRVVNVQAPWEGVQPYLVGSEPGLGYAPPERPINQDWIAWNRYMSQGLPVGLEPPMFLDDPRYTGEGVYEAPFTYTEPAQNLAYGDPYSEYGSVPGGLGTVNPNPYGDATDIYGAAPGLLAQAPSAAAPEYPSQGRPQDPSGTPEVPQPAPEESAASSRYSPWLGRMVLVDDKGNVAESIDELIEEASIYAPSGGSGGGWHVNPRTGELVGNYALGTVNLWDTEPGDFFHQYTGGRD